MDCMLINKQQVVLIFNQDKGVENCTENFQRPGHLRKDCADLLGFLFPERDRMD